MSEQRYDLLRLLTAVRHYDRRGWLHIPEPDRWRYDALMSELARHLPPAREPEPYAVPTPDKLR